MGITWILVLLAVFLLMLAVGGLTAQDLLAAEHASSKRTRLDDLGSWFRKAIILVQAMCVGMAVPLLIVMPVVIAVADVFSLFGYEKEVGEFVWERLVLWPLPLLKYLWAGKGRSAGSISMEDYAALISYVIAVVIIAMFAYKKLLQRSGISARA